ncbi:MAG: ester cyclase family protein [Thermomicrobiales bacterium]
MSTTRFDQLSTVLAARLTRRSTMHAAGAGAGIAGAALLSRSGSAEMATPASSPEIACDAQDRDAIKALATRVLTEGFGQGMLAVVDEAYASESAIHHRPGGLGAAEGVDAIKDVMREIRGAYPDMEVTAEEVLSDGRTVVVRYTCNATFTNPLFGIEPTGERVTYDGINTFLFSCGKVIESWSELDSLTMLGLVSQDAPGPAATPQVEASPVVDCPQTSEAENATIVARWNDVWNTHDLDTIATLAHPDLVKHFGALPDAHGAAAAQEGIGQFLDAMPDLAATIGEPIVEGDLVAVRFTVTGTQTGEFLGVAPTGKVISWSGAIISRVACGLVIEDWSEVSSLSLWQQLGKVEVRATPVA